jgi:hypothetical protein
MMIEDLRTLLLEDAGLSDIVGSRVTWGTRPQGSALPAVVLHLIGGAKGYHLTAETGPRSARVQANCLASSYLTATDTFRAAAAALSGYSGTVGSTYFQGILQDSEPSDLNEADGATEQRTFGTSADFIVYHTPQE